MRQKLFTLFKLRALALVAFMCTAITGVWAQSDKSGDYTGNVKLSTEGGANASACKVVVDGTEYDGIKAGTSSKAGAFVLTVPSGTKYLHLHVAGWKGDAVTLSVTPEGYSESISVVADAGISNNSPFTLAGDASSEDFYKVITFAESLTAETDLTFTATAGKRFVVWGVTAEVADDSGEESVATTMTIDDTALTNTNIFEGTTAGVLTAVVKAGDNVIDNAVITWSSDNEEVATIDAEGAVTLVAAGSVTFTATYAGVENTYKPCNKNYRLTVVNKDPNGPGSLGRPYTVEEAIAAVEEGGNVTDVYATGIVSEIVTPFNPSFGNITYNISTDGTTEGSQLQSYRGLSLDGKWFDSEYDLRVGDKVVIYGSLTKYGETYEFSKNNYLVSLKHQAIEVTLVDGVNQPYDTYGARNTAVTPNTFTSNAASGVADVVLTAPVIDRAKWWDTQCLAIKNSAVQTDETVTITAPKGYSIQSVSMSLQAYSSSAPYDVTVNGETTRITGAAAADYNDIEVNGKSFTFTINSAGDAVNWLAIKALTLQLEVSASYFVQYEIVDTEGNILFTQDAVPAEKDDHITTLPEELKRPFYTYNDVDFTISSPNTKIQFVATWEGPIALSKDYESITWQNLYINRGENNYWYLTNTEELPLFVNNPTEKQRASDYYQWGFVGDGYNGVMIYNKATENNKVLANGNAVAMDVNNFVWDKFTPNTGSGQGILIGCSAGYLNQSGGATATKLGLWGSTSDNGSTWFVADVPEIAVTNVYFDVVFNEEVVKTAVVPGVGIGDELPDVPAELNNGLVTLIWDTGTVTEENQHIQVFAIANTPFEFSESYKDAKWYNMTIRSNYHVAVDETEPYYPKTATTIQRTADNYQWAFFGNPYYITVVNKAMGENYTLTKDDVIYADGSVKPSVVMRKGTYKWEAKSNSDGFTLKEIETINNVINQNGGKTGPLSFWTSSSAFGDDGSTFRIQEVPTAIDFTIGEAGYATMYLPFAVSAPEEITAPESAGITFYTGKIEGEYLNMSELKGAVPAYTPVVVKGKPGTYSFNIGGENETIEQNDLKGTMEDIEAEGKYVLAKPEGLEVGFYVASTGTIKAGKAYLEVESGVKAFYIAEDATGIKNVNVNDNLNNGIIYNLAGQRINKLQKGINIVNGKKVLK